MSLYLIFLRKKKILPNQNFFVSFFLRRENKQKKNNRNYGRKERIHLKKKIKYKKKKTIRLRIESLGNLIMRKLSKIGEKDYLDLFLLCLQKDFKYNIYIVP